MQALEPVFRIHPCVLLFLLLKVLLPLCFLVTIVVTCSGKKGTSKKSNKSQSAKRRPGTSDQVESDGGSDAPDSMAKTTPTGTPTVNGTTGPSQTEYLMTEINGVPPTCRNHTPQPTPQSVTPQPPSGAGAGTGLPQSYAAKPAPKMLTSITATPAAKTAAGAPPPSTVPTAPMTNAGTVKRAQTAKG